MPDQDVNNLGSTTTTPPAGMTDLSMTPPPTAKKSARERRRFSQIKAAGKGQKAPKTESKDASKRKRKPRKVHFCECGCGQETTRPEYPYLKGHRPGDEGATKKKAAKSPKSAKKKTKKVTKKKAVKRKTTKKKTAKSKALTKRNKCACGCGGLTTSPTATYIKGHNRRSTVTTKKKARRAKGQPFPVKAASKKSKTSGDQQIDELEQRLIDLRQQMVEKLQQKVAETEQRLAKLDEI